MNLTRPVAFWIAVLAAVVIAVVLLREVLLPFVAGMMLAYLLDPVATRLARMGLNRLVATLIIIISFIASVVVLIVLTIPVVIGELAYLMEHFPLYLKRVQALASDPGRPWLSKIIGEGVREAEQSIGEVASFASSWFGTFLRSLWSSGQALLSFFSLAVVAPV